MAIDLERKAQVARVAALAIRVVPNLRPGAGTLFDLPEREPERRDAYKAVNAAAHRYLGVGAYRLKSCPAGVMLVRLAAPKASATTAARERSEVAGG